MLTPEQIKNLKPGDPIVINASFLRVDTDGDIRFNAPSENGSQYGLFLSPDYVSLPSEHGTSVPTPTRLFRTGDRAQVVERNGRNVTCFPVGRIKVGDIVTVAENESGDVFIKVLTKDGHEMMVPWFMLELVTPVEEPYEVECDDDEKEYSVTFRDKFVCTFPYDSDSFYTKEQAKAAAEAECDRLNEAWRKEQNNG